MSQLTLLLGRFIIKLMLTLLDSRKKFKIADPTPKIGGLRGFTLIELLVVVGIIAILTALGAVSYSGAQVRARDTQRKSDVAVYQSALECYFASKHSYPATGAQLALLNENCTRENPAFVDPKTAASYIYNPYTSSAKTSPACSGTGCFYYEIVACLENTNDSQKDAVDTCAGATVSYTVKAP